MTPRPITSAPIVSTPSLSHSTALTTVSSTPPVPGGGTMACSLRSKRCPPLLLHTGAIISRMSNSLAYKIVVRHFLDEDKTIKHTEQCTDIVEFIPFSFWYDAPLTSQYRDRRHDPWQVYGSPSYSPARWSSWISPA